MMNLFTELKRRNVFKVGAAYLVLTWIVIQVAAAAVPALHLPEWINTAVFFFGVVGFPFALFFAWVFEITPEGVKKESEISTEESITAHTGRKLDFVIIGMLVLVAAYFIYESRFESSSIEELEIENQPATIQPEGSSIAVLPFVNMSSDKEQEYFSDGISEEILNVLAKIPHLKVTSRSSSFFYKGSKINISEVAEKLGVKNVLEGSVRKAGNRIRITAQLIQADTDTHLWSNTYDRELTDIFAVQDEISASIVEALKSKLGLNTKVIKRDMSQVNLEAHNEYLKGRFFIENRNRKDTQKALIHFEKAIVLAPDYALAWMGKAWASLFLSENNYGTTPREIAINNASIAIEKALALDPKLPEAYAIAGLIEGDSNNRDKAIINFKKAIELNPNYADAFSWYGNMLFGQPKERFIQYKKSIQLNPMSILTNNNFAYDLILYGRTGEARKVVDHMLSINPSNHLSYEKLAEINLAEGKYAEAIVAYENAIKVSPEDMTVRLGAVYVLSSIGLGEEAASYLDDTTNDAVKYWYKDNTELYISKIKAAFPRSEQDSTGQLIRALAEARTENYQEATKYFKSKKLDEFNNHLIYSFQQSGDAEAARMLLDKVRLQIKVWIDVNAKYFYSSGLMQPILLMEMEQAYLDGDIEKAISILKTAMLGNYILNFEYKKSAIYKELREHPEWPSILIESDKRAAMQRNIYLALVAKKAKKIH